MIKFTSDELRKLADAIDNNHKYHCKCGIVYVSIQEHPNGRKYLEFEQPSDYAECSSEYYRFDDDEI